MAIHVRNVVSLDGSVSTGVFASRHLVLLRELFLAGRWTQSAISNAATWDANIVVNNSDVAVNSASPGRVTSATGGFTGRESFGITLLGGVLDDDNNRGVYRIVAVISDTEVEVAPPPPDGWVTDTGMTCRVFNWGLASPVSSTQYVVMDPPSGNSQAYIGKPATNYYFDLRAYPRGSYPTYPTQAEAPLAASGDRYARWNAYFDGANAVVYFYTDTGIWHVFVWGELEDCPVEDLYPGFLAYGADVDAFNLTGGDIYTLRLLYDNGGGSIGQIDGRVATVCRGTNIASARQNILSLTRLVKEKAQIVKPWVYMVGANGGYFRGRHPLRYTNLNWEQWRPMTSDGTWRHLRQSGVFPMNGPNDPRPIGGAA